MSAITCHFCGGTRGEHCGFDCPYDPTRPTPQIEAYEAQREQWAARRDCTLLATRVQLLCVLRNRARRVLPPVAYVLCELDVTIVPDPLPPFTATLWGAKP